MGGITGLASFAPILIGLVSLSGTWTGAMFVGVVAFWGVYGIIFWLATPVEPVRLGLPEVAGMTIGALALTLVARLIALGFRWVYRKMFPGKRSRQRVSG